MFTKKNPALLCQAQREKGFTLTEIAIVLGIMGLILGAIWTAASGVYTNQRTAHAQTAVLQIAQAIRSMYASQASIAPGTPTAAVLNMLLPSDLSGGVGPFPNGAIGVIGNGTGDGFTIEMTAVPLNNCISLLTGIGGISRDPGLFEAGAVANAAIAAGDESATTLAPLAGPVTTVQATTAASGSLAAGTAAGGCAAATSPSKIVFGFSLK